MAIRVPGLRDRHHRTNKSRRSVVAILSLTAMVDMFTVLAVFLLQNYQTTGEVIELSDEVILPNAQSVRELKPAIVVVVSNGKVMIDKLQVATLDEVNALEDSSIIQNLKDRIEDAFRDVEQKAKSGLGAVKNVVAESRGAAPKPEDFRRVTLQADKAVSAGAVKKVMWTLTEAGASEINFAVLRVEGKDSNSL
ncbi:MAG TPA: biopolymer transporter ExbD [Pseudobdellovibrionaceae bacterium]|nr:biopolymer transporter ExbD [Pseudobdellovibrionaceae bacterium]